MNGDARYTDANMNLPNYFEKFQGLDGQPFARVTGVANAQRGCDGRRLWHRLAGRQRQSPRRPVYITRTSHQPGTSDDGRDDGDARRRHVTINNTNLTINTAPRQSAGRRTTRSKAAGRDRGHRCPAYFGQKVLDQRLNAQLGCYAAHDILTHLSLRDRTRLPMASSAMAQSERSHSAECDH